MKLGVLRVGYRLRQLVGAVVVLVLGGYGCSVVGASQNHQGHEEESLANRRIGQYLSNGLNRPGFRSEEVRQALSRVPRHKFIPEDMIEFAYDDSALPIGYGQTISQPYIVALMTQEAAVEKGAKVLEVGTGSGYQAAVLAELGAKVFSIEIVPELARRAEDTLKELGYGNVVVLQGDGWSGLEEEAPFDAILVTASSPGFPPRLLSQLGEEGRMIIPIEREDGSGETLMLVEREGEGVTTRNLGRVKFVPLTGKIRKAEHLFHGEDLKSKELFKLLKEKDTAPPHPSTPVDGPNGETPFAGKEEKT